MCLVDRHTEDKKKDQYRCICFAKQGTKKPDFISQTTTAAAPARTAPIPQAQPVTSAATRGALPLLLAVTVAVTVTR